MEKQWSVTITYLAESGHTEDESWEYDVTADSVKAAKQAAMKVVRQAMTDKLAEDPYNRLACDLELYLKYYSPHWKKVPPLGYRRYYQTDYNLRKHELGVFIELHPHYKEHNGVRIPVWVDTGGDNND